MTNPDQAAITGESATLVKSSSIAHFQADTLLKYYSSVVSYSVIIVASSGAITDLFPRPKYI